MQRLRKIKRPKYLMNAKKKATMEKVVTAVLELNPNAFSNTLSMPSDSAIGIRAIKKEIGRANFKNTSVDIVKKTVLKLPPGIRGTVVRCKIEDYFFLHKNTKHTAFNMDVMGGLTVPHIKSLSFINEEKKLEAIIITFPASHHRGDCIESEEETNKRKSWLKEKELKDVPHNRRRYQFEKLSLILNNYKSIMVTSYPSSGSENSELIYVYVYIRKEIK